MTQTISTLLNQLDWPRALRAGLLTIVFCALIPWLDSDTILTLVLGLIAAGLADGPDFYRQPFASITMMLVSFSLASLSVTLLFPYPWLFALGLVSSTYLFMLMPVVGQKYGSIALSSLIVAVYTMLGYHSIDEPLMQPVWLVTGALLYACSALLFDRAFPTLSLDKQLRQMYRQLSGYAVCKARLFQDGANAQEILQQLRERAAAISERGSQIRYGLFLQQQRLRGQIGSEQMDKFFLGQLLFERLSAAHFAYSGIQRLQLKPRLRAQVRQVLVDLSRCITNDENDLAAVAQRAKALAGSEPDSPALIGLLDNVQHCIELLAEPPEFPEPEHQFTTRTGSGLIGYIKQSLTLNTNINRHALRVSSLMLIGYGAVLLSGHDQAFWLMLSCVLVTKPNYQDTKSRFSQRSIGTAVGILLAALLAQLYLPWFAASLLLAILVLSFFLIFHHNYGLAVCLITLFVGLSLTLQGSQGGEVLVIRLVATLSGSLMALAALRWFWPDWGEKHTKGAVADALLHGQQYLHSVSLQLLEQQSDELQEFRMSRYHSQQSSAHLLRHWQQLMAEPQSKRATSPQLYRFIGHYQNFLSHTAALSAHRTQQISPKALKEIDGICQLFCSQLGGLHAYLEKNELWQASVNDLTTDVALANRRLLPLLQGSEQIIAFQLQLLAEDVSRMQAEISEGGW